MTIQQIRAHGPYDHLPSGSDQLPWLGEYPFGNTATSLQGIHMVGVTANMPTPSLGTQSGSDGAATGTAFTSASGRFTTHDTGDTVTITDIGASPPVVYQFTVTYVSGTALTLSGSWAGTGSSSLPWVLTGRGPSNAGLGYTTTDTSPGGSFVSDGTKWVPGGGIFFNFDNEGGGLSIRTNSAVGVGPNPGSGISILDNSGHGSLYLGNEIFIWADHSLTFGTLTWAGFADNVVLTAASASTTPNVATIIYQFDAAGNGNYASWQDIASGNAEYARIGLGKNLGALGGNWADLGVVYTNAIFDLDASDGVFLISAGHGGAGLVSDNGGGIFFNDYGAGGTFFDDRDGGGVYFNDYSGLGQVDMQANQIALDVRPGTGGQLAFYGIPTSNPGGSGYVWNNAGVLNIT